MNSSILRFSGPKCLLHPVVITGIILLTGLFVWPGDWPAASGQGSASLSQQEEDTELQRVAHLALGDHEGTVIVMDAQTGRIRALVNPRLASQETFAPGSTIKPFAALAAMRTGLISETSRLSCGERYERGDFEISCSHPKDQPAFGPAQALAFSCNYYFGELGERLSQDAFNRTLIPFGFGARTGFSGTEAAGILPRVSSRASDALGEGGEMKVTPLQLVTAYAALVNGGRLFVPQMTSAPSFGARDRARLEIADQHRKVLIEGMRGAVEHGTAQSADLDSLPANIIGKTGTSTASDDGGRTQGWFIGLAGDGDVKQGSPPESFKLVVLVFMKRAHGADAAEASRIVFDEFARMGSRGEAEASGRGDTEQVAAPARLTTATDAVRVHLVRENVTKTLPLEDYVLGVVAAEGSIEDEMGALKALAVASRTYAVKNLGRHKADGYDFCTTTHCQRYFPVTRDQVRAAIGRATIETEGEVLRDADDRIVEAYFSASCGGMTADIHTLWGAPRRTYLRPVRDEYCKDMPHSHWTDAIPADSLVRALESDMRSNVGNRLDQIRIVKKDATGRAQLIELAGERRRTISGWDFKIIVGRALGWNLLKSSRFEVRRDGPNFVFRGTGFGHGLGLCQEGAHMMAASGLTYSHILARYFPETTIGKQTVRRASESD